MSANVPQSSSSEALSSDYMSPIKIFGQAKMEIGDIFYEISNYIAESLSLLHGLFSCFAIFV